MTLQHKIKIGTLVQDPKWGVGIVVAHSSLGSEWYQVEWAKSGKCRVSKDEHFTIVS